MSEERRRQIIEEATQFFGRYGFDKVTIKQLAQACGITEPALYRYFPSKAAIYDEVLNSIKSLLNYDELFRQLESEPDIKKIFPALASHILDFFNNNTELYRLLLYSTLREHAKARTVFRTIRGPYVDFLKNKLDLSYKQGFIRKKNNEITARCFIGMVFDCALGISLWKGFLGKNYKPEEVIANNVPIFINGLLLKP